MPAIGRGESSDCANPVLDVYTQVNGVLTDVDTVEFQIWDDSTGTPVQVYPPSGRHTVDHLTACPTGDQLATGHYVARWTAPLDEVLGTHQVRWFVKLTPVSPEQTFIEEFEVLNVAVQSEIGYCLIQDLRNEGVTTEMASDNRLAALIARASAFIDKVTKRFFSPRARTITIDGAGTPVLRLGAPIIGISSIKVNGDLADPETYKVYNRHLSQGLLHPDDRNDPRIEKILQSVVFGLERDFSAATFRKGTQNIEVEGVFGYTDVPAGTATATEGVTPELIRYACMRLVIRALPKLTSSSLSDGESSGLITQLRTRDQTIVYGNDPRFRGLTTDAEIDQILLMYTAPPFIGSPGTPL